jgi:hypothetical protein
MVGSEDRFLGSLEDELGDGKFGVMEGRRELGNGKWEGMEGWWGVEEEEFEMSWKVGRLLEEGMEEWRRLRVTSI